MRKVSLILSILAVIAVGVLYVLYFTGNGSSSIAGETGNAGTVTASKGDIVYVQLDSLINQYDMYNDLRTEFEGKLSAVENDLNKKGRALENDVQSFNEKMSKGLLTRSQAETMGNDLARRQQELQALSQQKQMEMAEEESVLFNKVMDAITTYMAEYNKTRQYALILTTNTSTQTVINGDNGLNITQEVVNGLNSEYIKNRNRK